MADRKDARLLERIGARVASLRRARGWTQEALAAKVGLQSESVSRFEHGNHALSLWNLSRMAEALGVTLGDLLDASRPEPEPPTGPEAAELLRAFEHLDAAGRRVAARLIRDLADHWPSERREPARADLHPKTDEG